MHEIGMLYQIAETTTSFASKNKIDEVQEITLDVGELSGVVPEIFTEYFEYVSEQFPVIHRAKLKLNMVRAEGLCSACSCMYDVSKYEGICPNCQCREKVMLGGTDIRIRSLAY